jgi:hypothetical protein
MDYRSPDVPGLSAWSLVSVRIKDGWMVVRQCFSTSTHDERSLSRGEGLALLRMVDYTLAHPGDGWDVLLDSRDRAATVVRFDQGMDSSRPGGPGIVRFDVKGMRFLLDERRCAEFRIHLGDALDLLVVSEVMES